MKRILFIDDEPIRAWPLAQKGHHVRVAHGFEQVHFYLQQCPGYRPDVICLDHDMPMMNGYHVAQSFLIARSIPVMIHSTNEAGAKDIERLLQEYAVPCERAPIHEASPENWIKWLEHFVAESNTGP